MSFEATKEYITKKGIYFTCDYHDDETKYIDSDDEISYYHLIDNTNGDFEVAERQQIGYYDTIKEDYLGNRYHVQKIKYMPVSLNWKKYKGN